MEGIRGPWLNVVFNDGLVEAVVPFQTVSLVAQNQAGSNVTGVQLHVYKLDDSPFAPGTVISVPQGAKTLVRGQLAGIRGPWLNVQFEAGLSEVVVPFWTATFAAVDTTGNPLNEAQFAVYKLDGTFLPGGLLTLPKEAKALIRALIAGQRQSWQTFIFSEGLEEITPAIS